MLTPKLVLNLWDILSKPDQLSGVIWSCCGSKLIVKDKVGLLESLRLRGSVYNSFVHFCQVLRENCFKEDEMIPGVFYHQHFLRDDPSKLCLIGVASNHSDSSSPEACNLDKKDSTDEVSSNISANSVASGEGGSGKFYLDMSRLLLSTMTSFCEQLTAVKSELTDLKSKVEVSSRAADLRYEQMMQKNTQLKNEVKDLKTKLKTSSTSASKCSCTCSKGKTKSTENGTVNSSHLYMTSLNQRIRERLLKLNDFTADKLSNPFFLEEYLRLKLIPFLFLLNNKFQRGIDSLQKPVGPMAGASHSKTSTPRRQNVSNGNQNKKQCNAEMLTNINMESSNTEVVKNGSGLSSKYVAATQSSSTASQPGTNAVLPVPSQKQLAPDGSEVLLVGVPAWAVKLTNEFNIQNNHIKNLSSNLESRSFANANKTSPAKRTSCQSEIKNEPSDEIDVVSQNQKQPGFLKTIANSNVGHQKQLISKEPSPCEKATHPPKSSQPKELPIQPRVVKDNSAGSSNFGQDLQTSHVQTIPREVGLNSAKFLNRPSFQKAFPSFSSEAVKNFLRKDDSSLKRSFLESGKSGPMAVIAPPPKKVNTGKSKDDSAPLLLVKTPAIDSAAAAVLSNTNPLLKRLMEKVNSRVANTYLPKPARDKPVMSYPPMVDPAPTYIPLSNPPNQRPAILNNFARPTTQSSTVNWKSCPSQSKTLPNKVGQNSSFSALCDEPIVNALKDNSQLTKTLTTSCSLVCTERGELSLSGTWKQSASEPKNRASSLNDLEKPSEVPTDDSNKKEDSSVKAKEAVATVSEVRSKEANQDKEIDAFLMHF